MTKPDLCWNVFYENINSRKIEEFNIFDHYSFVEDCAKDLKKYKDNEDAAKERVRRNLMYYFWSKCEYEVIISAWVNPRNEDIERKIDVYEQVMLNRDVFLDYVWEHRKDFPKLLKFKDEEIKNWLEKFKAEQKEVVVLI